MQQSKLSVCILQIAACGHKRDWIIVEQRKVGSCNTVNEMFVTLHTSCHVRNVIYFTCQQMPGLIFHFLVFILDHTLYLLDLEIKLVNVGIIVLLTKIFLVACQEANVCVYVCACACVRV